MAEEVHDFTENKSNEQYTIEVVKLIFSGNTLPESFFKLRMEQIERYNKPEKQPVVCHFPNEHIQRFRRFAEIVNKYALIKPLKEVNKDHFKPI